MGSPNQGQIVAKVPNGEEMAILQREGEHLKVRWNQIEAWAKACNVQLRDLTLALRWSQIEAWAEACNVQLPDLPLALRWSQIEAWPKACSVQQRQHPSPIPAMA